MKQTSLALTILSIFCLAHTLIAEEPATDPKSSARIDLISDESFDLDNAPTYITSDSLDLDSLKRVFTYKGKVKIEHGDLLMKAGTLDGSYTEQNKITDLIARTDVFIEKGPSIKARSQKAFYNAIDETLVLTDNPELEQGESILSADEITIYLKENRSSAKGTVRVKVVEEKVPGATNDAPGERIDPNTGLMVEDQLDPLDDMGEQFEDGALSQP